MSVVGRMLRPVSPRGWFAAIASRVAPGLDRLVYRMSGRRRLATPRSLPTFMLTTTGRRSGLKRMVPLVYVEDGGDFLVVGTNWGRSTTPEWALNLAANPRCVIEVPGEAPRPATAAEIPRQQHASFWERFEELWPAYSVYRERAVSRRVKMFRLTPAGSD